MPKMNDKLRLRDVCDAFITPGAHVREAIELGGVFHMTCSRGGDVVWEETYRNTVMDLGVNALFNFALDSAFAPYTVTGPFMGLISSDAYSAISATNTMASHPGWTEAGATHLPFYSGTANRKTCAWLAAATRTKVMDPPNTFAITADGTVKGTFIVFGTGATNVIDATTGTLFCAGLFASGDRAVFIGDVLNATYQISA